MKTIKILQKKISWDGEMKTTVFMVSYSHVTDPRQFYLRHPDSKINSIILAIMKCPVSGIPIFEMERSMTKFFGIKTFGVHVNCFFRNKKGQICLWVGRRSPTKETWPGLLDNCFAGRSLEVTSGSFSAISANNFRWLYSRFGYNGNSCEGSS